MSRCDANFFSLVTFTLTLTTHSHAMGNDQSRTKDASGETAGPIDYYELLQVDEEATYDEIKAGPATMNL